MSKAKPKSTRTRVKAGAGAKVGAAKPRARVSKPRKTGASGATRPKREPSPTRATRAPGPTRAKRETPKPRETGASEARDKRTAREKRETGETRPAKSAPARRSGGPKLPADVKAAFEAALDKKAVDPVLLDLRQASAFTDFFLIFTGANTRQVQAIADSIQETLRKKGTRAALIEGSRRAEWILIDYFDFIVHIFTPTTREFYALERLWGDGERIEVSSV